MNRSAVVIAGGFVVVLGLLLWGTSAVVNVARVAIDAPVGGGPPTTGRDAYRTGQAAYQRGDLVAALAEWTKVAETDARAQAGLGDIYLRGGSGIEADRRAAMTWYYRAAASKNTHAEMALGGIFAEGMGVAVDFSLSGYWYRNAGMHGIPEGAYIAAGYLEVGRGQRADAVDATAWYALASELGHPDAAAARDRGLATLSPVQRTLFEQRMNEFHHERRTGDATLVGPASAR